MRTQSARYLAPGLLIASAVFVACGSPSSPDATGTADRTLPTNDIDGSSAVRVTDGAAAVESALDAVRFSGEVARAGFISRRDLIGRIATDRFAPVLSAESASELAGVERELSEVGVVVADLVWEEIPLRVSSTVASPDRVHVEVWSVLIFGVPGFGAPRQAWRTSWLEMARVEERWLVDGWTSTEGPTPALAPSALVSELGSVEQVLAWDHVDGGS